MLKDDKNRTHTQHLGATHETIVFYLFLNMYNMTHTHTHSAKKQVLKQISLKIEIVQFVKRCYIKSTHKHTHTLKGI